MFLEFGNVVIGLNVFIVAVLALMLIAEIGLFIGRFALAVDEEGCPVALTNNPITSLIKKCFSGNITKKWGKYFVYRIDDHTDYYVRGNSGNWYYNRDKVNCLNYCAYDTLEEAKKHFRYSKTHFSGIHLFEFLVKAFTLALGIDIMIKWFQIHFLSAVVVLGFTGIVLGMRLISKFLWKNMTKTDKIDERVKKLEDN